MKSKQTRCCFEVLETRTMLNGVSATAEINNGPVLDPSGVARFAMIGKGITNSENMGQTVQSLIDSVWPLNMVTDSDAGALRGIAVTGVNKSLGNWRFSTDAGAHWFDVGEVSESQALLLRDEDRLRFIPDGTHADTATATFRAWDQTGTTAGQQGTKVAVGTPGGSSPFSTATETASIAVAAVLPVYIPKDIIGVPGSVVTAPLRITEAEGLRGADIALRYDTGLLDATNADVKVIDSVWPGATFSANVNDSTGTIIVSISKFPALGAGGGSLMKIDFTIRSDAPVDSQIKIDLEEVGLNEGHMIGTPVPLPGEDPNNSMDPTDGLITVVAPNHAPALLDTAVALDDEQEDAAAPVGAVGTLVSDLIDLNPPPGGQDNVGDTDSIAVAGMAVIGANTANGTWHFSPNGGSTWNLLGAVSPVGARLLAADAATRVYFQPNANYHGIMSDALTFRAWDQSGGSNGQWPVDTSINGGTTAFSSAADTAAISVTAVNDAPSFTKGADQTVNEDASAQTVSAWATNVSAGPANESSQTLSFQVTNDNNGLFAVQPAVASDGTLTYTPAANANGSATVTVVLKDDGGTDRGGADTSAAQTFKIVVNAVNDAPSFTKGADQTVNEDASAQSVPAWATNVSAGPSNESSQTLSFQATNDNNGLFAVQPAVAPDGTLTYTPAADANGSATVTVVAKDNGGTDRGGTDASAAQTFKITVSPVNDSPRVTGFNKSVPRDESLHFSSGDFAAHFADVDSDSLQKVKINDLPDHGTLMVGSSPVAINQEISSASLGDLAYVPTAGYEGADGFQWDGSDGIAYSGTSATTTINVGGNGTIAGYVFCDGNGDGVYNGELCIPLVTVTLQVLENGNWVDYAQNPHQQTTDAGWYGFARLPAGSYRVVEAQPAAFSEGGPNQIVVDLASNQQRTDVNFANGFLRPEHISKRLFLVHTPPFARFVANLDQPPLVDSNGILPGSDFTAVFTPGQGAVKIAANDATITDADSATLTSLSITITNRLDGDNEVLDVADTVLSGRSISKSYANGLLTLRGVDRTSDYEAVLRAITFNNRAASPRPGNRVLSIIAFDGSRSSKVVQVTIEDPPAAQFAAVDAVLGEEDLDY